MPLTFHAFWMLCGLGSAVFATAVVSGPRWPLHWTALAIGFVLTAVWLARGRSLDAASIGCLVAAVAFWHLVRAPSPVVLSASAGALAATWASLLQVEGLSKPLALAFSAVVPFTAAYLSQRRPAFAPSIVREEALLGLTALALVVAVAPTVSQGWQSALALNLTDKSGSTPHVPLWLLSCIGGSMTLGGLWSLWRRG